jgi:hypothetical protein
LRGIKILSQSGQKRILFHHRSVCFFFDKFLKFLIFKFCAF